MDQSLQFRKRVDKEIRRSLFERLGRVTVGDSTRGDTGIPPGQNIDGGVADHPSPFPMTFRVRQYLIYAHRIGLFMIEAVAPIHGCKMFIDPQAVEHRATEMDRLVGQNSELAV